MKELTIEEKAQRYDEALENARYYHAEMGDDIKVVLEECFPELKEIENEDEKIIKALKEEFKYHQLFNPTFGGISCIEIINWLEKKDKQKSVVPSEEQMENLSRAFNGGTYRTSLLMELYNDLKKLTKQ